MNQNEHIGGESTYSLKNIVRKLFVLCLGLLATLFFIQTAKLATVGRMGSEISGLEVKQEELKLENEILRSKISELRSSEQIKNSVQKDQNLGIVNVNIIPSIKDIENQTDVIAAK